MNNNAIRSLMKRVGLLERDVSRMPSRFSRGGAGGSPLRLVKITGSAAIASTSNRWAYTVVDASARPNGTMVAVAGAVAFTAYNPGESFNDGAGVEGNGVDRANLPAGWSMQPIGTPTGALVYRTLKCDDQGAPDGHTWWILTTLNNDDGACA